ncbi:MAG: VWA domain-containing protein [Terriglobales bacterium]
MMMMSSAVSRSALPLLLLIALAASAPLRGQMLPQAPSGPLPHPTHLPPSAAPAPPAPPAGSGRGSARIPTLVVNSNLVNVVFSVEHNHAFVPGLTRNDFRVLENGQPQRIEFFSASQDLPLTLGWLLDTSPSQLNLLPEEQALSGQFFHQVVQPKDLAFVLGFDSGLHLLQDLTNSTRFLTQAVNRAHIGGGSAASVLNPGPFPQSGGGTLLWDAIVAACRGPLAQQVGRKAIVVITDGQDQGSRHTPAQAARALLDSNTILFAVIAADPGAYGGFYRGAGQLSHVAQLSGGQTYYARRGQMVRDFNAIAAALRSQYSLGYQPSVPLSQGGYRRIQVELIGAAKHSGKVRARVGYYAHP